MEKQVFSAVGVAQALGRSDNWAREQFERRVIPTEFQVDGKRPAVSGETLAKIATQLERGKR